MTGDKADIASRIRSVLPTRWFSDKAPVLEAMLDGLATAWASMYALLAFVRSQARLATASGSFLDIIGADFFADRLLRRGAEADERYRNRVSAALVREHATRAALANALLQLTGRSPAIFEPARPADTGAYSDSAMGYGAAGGWGNLSLPFQSFVTVYRPHPSGIASLAGYGTGGPLGRATLAEAGTQLLDADIMATIASVLPTASIAWTRITN